MVLVHPSNLLLLLLVQAIILLITPSSEAVEPATPCLTREDCDKGYDCRFQRCTKNRYERGCLREKLPDHAYYGLKQRVCNSDDDHQLAKRKDDTICRFLSKEDDTPTTMRHMELRLHSQNWEAAFFEVWILQIVLSELLEVPTTIETGVPNVSLNFYDPHAPFGYGLSSDYQAIATAHEVGDCRWLNTGNDNLRYQSCAHAVTEVWDVETDEIEQLLDTGILEPPQLLGVLGNEALFVPKFTAAADPTLVSYLGLQGEHNRRKLAETFLRPTTWGEYCELVSSDGCASDDGIAKHPPSNQDEATRMFVPHAYIGHFRNTSQNDCDTYPDTCTGHVADYPCGWPSFAEQQMFHLDIALESNGPEPHSGGYSYQQLQEMWLAANATKSNVMMMYYKPELNYQSFLHSEAEFTKITLPPRTQECIDARIRRIEDRCHPDPMVRRGKKAGACDKDYQQLYKVIASNLVELLEDDSIPEGKRSPAYQVLSLFAMSSEYLGQMFDLRKELGDPRDAVCTWVVDHLEDVVAEFIPQTYPRVFREEDELWVLLHVAVALGVVALAVVVGTCAAVYHQRHRRVMRVAQVEFLWLLLGGLLGIALAAILAAVPPTDGICVAQVWFINVGYTLCLVPLIVKIGAINRLLRAAQKMRRVVLNRAHLFAAVALILAIVVVVSIVWTVVDPPQKHAEYTVTDHTTGDEGRDTVVLVQYSCQSNHMVFEYLNLAWTSMLLFIATILAFQARNLRQDFNESQTLGMMIYSHFLFVLLRMITFFLESSSLSGPTLSRARSVIYSVDTMATIGIYFLPKLLSKDLPDNSVLSFTGSNRNQHNNNLHQEREFLQINDRPNNHSYPDSQSVNPASQARSEITARSSLVSAVSIVEEKAAGNHGGGLQYKMESLGEDEDSSSTRLRYTFSSEGIVQEGPAKSVSFLEEEQDDLSSQEAAAAADGLLSVGSGVPDRNRTQHEATAAALVSGEDDKSPEAAPESESILEVECIDNSATS